MSILEPLRPSVHSAIWQLRPDFAALSIVVRNGRNVGSGHPDAAVRTGRAPAEPWWCDAHVESWRDAYRAFGEKPQRTPSSVDALRRRLAKEGSLPRINAIVDLYNQVSVDYALPVGGEDLSRYVGAPRLVRAAGDETFETMRDGVPAVETAAAGEVIWRDDAGVTCRRWNWRQSVRTRLTEQSTEMWFVLERLEPMPIAALEEAGNALVRGVRILAPDAEVATALIARESA